MALHAWTDCNLPRNQVMSIQSDTCVAVFLGLLLASMLMQWVRAKMRKKLIQLVDPALLIPIDQEKWISVEKSFDFMFKDFRKLQIVKKNVGRLSGDFQVKLNHYRIFSRTEIFVTVSMLLFGSIAFLFCN